MDLSALWRRRAEPRDVSGEELARLLRRDLHQFLAPALVIDGAEALGGRRILPGVQAVFRVPVTWKLQGEPASPASASRLERSALDAFASLTARDRRLISGLEELGLQVEVATGRDGVIPDQVVGPLPRTRADRPGTNLASEAEREAVVAADALVRLDGNEIALSIKAPWVCVPLSGGGAVVFALEDDVVRATPTPVGSVRLVVNGGSRGQPTQAGAASACMRTGAAFAVFGSTAGAGALASGEVLWTPQASSVPPPVAEGRLTLGWGERLWMLPQGGLGLPPGGGPPRLWVRSTHHAGEQELLLENRGPLPIAAGGGSLGEVLLPGGALARILPGDLETLVLPTGRVSLPSRSRQLPPAISVQVQRSPSVLPAPGARLLLVASPDWRGPAERLGSLVHRRGLTSWYRTLARAWIDGVPVAPGQAAPVGPRFEIRRGDLRCFVTSPSPAEAP